MKSDIDTDEDMSLSILYLIGDMFLYCVFHNQIFSMEHLFTYEIYHHFDVMQCYKQDFSSII